MAGTTGLDLKYLFTVRYTSKETLEQDPQDRPLLPGSRSSWDDVDLARVEVVGLVSPTDEKRQLFCDLRFGHFVLGGLPFFVGENPPPLGCGPLRPVYFRQVERNTKVRGVVVEGQVKTFGRVGAEMVTVRYCIGWEITVAGKTYREVVGVF